MLPGAERRALGLNPSRWYWYEIGVHKKPRLPLVEIRVRVYDDKREHVVVEFDPLYCRIQPGGDKGFLQLTGPAKFAEVYVDPWWSRWTDDRRNDVIWNTEVVPDGDYYLIAEVNDGKTVQFITSDYQVQVRNAAQAAAGNN
jgi:hypothetical protein